MNQKGPGEAYFVRCDMSKEDDVKVITFHLTPIWSFTVLPAKSDSVVTFCLQGYNR